MRRTLLAALVAVALLAGSSFESARAQGLAAPAATVADFWFAGTRLVFERPQMRGGRLAISSDDAGLGRLLTKVNATLAYQPGQSYVVVTTGDRRTIAFTVGDARYLVGSTQLSAAFAPYVSGGAAYLPFAELAAALDLGAVNDGPTTVLQPQIAALDVRAAGRVTIVTLRGATPLRFKRLTADGADGLTLAFTGISSTLEHVRQIGAPALRGMTISPGGFARNPTTVVAFDTAAGAAYALAPGDSPNSLSIAFAPGGTNLGGTPVPAAGDATLAVAPLAVRDAALAPPPPPAPPSLAGAGGPTAPSTAPTPTALGLQTATVTDVHLDPIDEGLNVNVGIAGPVTYEWHRLPDERWYVDLKPATLAMDAQDIPVTNAAVLSLRVKGFVGPNDHLPTVRIALTLATPRIVNVLATNDGLQIAVDRLDDLELQKTGVGEIAGGKLVASVVPLPAASPETTDDGTGAGTPAGWKFAPGPVVNPRLIVLDPGHGGSDDGAMHNGLVEKELALDISQRLRSLLLAHGWLVKMTRDSDVDVYQPNDSAHDELQARCDVANNAGARLFISVHINSFTSSDLNGTTTYYYKADSFGFADAVHARLAANLPTKDDGIRKENFYVIHHTTAPAILVETAFLSNPGDAQLLHSEAFRQKVASSIAAGVGDYATPGKPLSSNADAATGGN